MKNKALKRTVYRGFKIEFSKKAHGLELFGKISVSLIAFAKSKVGKKKKLLWAILHGALLKVKK
ncbi:MAG: hypothetical protein HQ541_20700 [Mariniphaga sp.]|nr:hypothetical protein [Mariniphaga sp.]